MIDYVALAAQLGERRAAEEAERQAARDAGEVPAPIMLTPTGPGYRSLACAESGCRWHAHYADPAEGDAKYRAHYETVHSA
ncbi:MAG: hypothetical protein ABWY58_01675 [Aeromicrobium sp.]